MRPRSAFRCKNCGTILEIPAERGFLVSCPVCQLENQYAPAAAGAPITRDTLARCLEAMIAQARADGLGSESIVGVLRDELEFAAELAQTGRRVCVQILDLGPFEGQAPARPLGDRNAILRGRVVGG